MGYFDRTSGNQDPFIWNRHFLHSYCHITQLHAAQRGDINFWVSSDNLQTLPNLFCDLVFVVKSRHVWSNRNSIQRSDSIVDSQTAYEDHFRWVKQHPFSRRNRFTLKAFPNMSFQPQDDNGDLIDILPILQRLGLSYEKLLQGLVNGHRSKPLQLDPAFAQALYKQLRTNSSRRIKGSCFEYIRTSSPFLASRWP